MVKGLETRTRGTRGLRRPFRLAAVLLVMSCIVVAHAAEPAGRHFREGMPLVAALQQLERDGLQLVYSSQIVSPSLVVVRPVTSRDPRRQLDELLRPHGLAVTEGPGGVLIVVKELRAPATKEPPSSSPDLPRLTMEDEIIVVPSGLSLLEDAHSPNSLGRVEIQSQAAIGSDIFRALDVVPGVTTGDVSAEIHVRGARPDEVLVILDGQELYSPYHLRDFDSPLGIVDSSTLDRVTLMSGTFPVSYGNRAAGVLDMTTIPASSNSQMTLAADVLGARIAFSDTSADGRLGGLATARRGSTDLIGRAFETEDPRFWDLFGKIGYDASPTQSGRLTALVANDSLHYHDPDDVRRIDTDYENASLWTAHQWILSQALYVNTIFSAAHLEQRRFGFEQDALRAYDVDDVRRFDVLGVNQSWGWQAGERHLLGFGFEHRAFDARYDYASSREWFGRNDDESSRVFVLDDRFRTRQTSLWVSDRIHPIDRLVVEIGLRLDRNGPSDERSLSPRLSTVWATGPGDSLRFAWGRYSQSQRPDELMVEDGESTFHAAEDSEQWAVGYEHALSPTAWLPLRSIRTEAYVRDSRNPRPRHEGLFAPFHPFPEGDVVRVRIDPDRSRARGLDVLVRGRDTIEWNWWVSYTLAETYDVVEGEQVARRFDQTHALHSSVTWRPSPRWGVNLNWRFHTGWPMTRVTLEQADGAQVLVVGPLNRERMSDYSRVDLRVSRELRARGGALTLYLDAQNLLNSGNQAGLDLNVDDESGQLEIRDEEWPGFVATAGFIWRFGGISGD